MSHAGGTAAPVVISMLELRVVGPGHARPYQAAKAKIIGERRQQTYNAIRAPARLRSKAATHIEVQFVSYLI